MEYETPAYNKGNKAHAKNTGLIKLHYIPCISIIKTETFAISINAVKSKKNIQKFTTRVINKLGFVYVL